MAIHELAELTWEDVRDLDRARTVALLPVGAIEASIRRTSEPSPRPAGSRPHAARRASSVPT
jgi:hypothetical protein